MTRAALLALALCGCGSTALSPQLVTDARKVTAAAAEPLREITPRLNRVGAVLRAACEGPEPLLPPDKCAEAIGAFNPVAIEVTNLQARIQQLDLLLAVLESSAKAAQ